MSVMRSVLLAGSQSAWTRERAAANIGTILTRLGENTTSAGEADEVREHYLQVLEKIRAGALRTVISIKLTQLGLDIDEEMCFRNLRVLVERAAALNNLVWIDMESSPYVD